MLEAGPPKSSVSRPGGARKVTRNDDKGPGGDDSGGASERSSYTNDSEVSEKTGNSAASSARKGQSDGNASQRSSNSQAGSSHLREAQTSRAQTYQSVAVWDWSADGYVCDFYRYLRLLGVGTADVYFTSSGAL